MIRLTKEKITQLHTLLISETGGADSVRDMGLLESALEQPFATFAGQELYPTLTDKAARLGFSLISNHPFVDGNKRIGVFAMLIFLQINGASLTCTNDDVIRLGLGVASGSMKYDAMLDWIQTFAHL